ncbi:hypothetical protein EJ02DRAFT_514293 [Clathrospora elynae]|uniref:Uncharacterized protein n=1 Tax=Clathrospora elynae TaxID=706981 RepID=A0A6A5SGG3_9PLEO|nr:hypothetical protein EJ02DRAFT_514293 [Clathrospora elynae]
MSDRDSNMGSRDGTPDTVITIPDASPPPQEPATSSYKKLEKIPAGLKEPLRPKSVTFEFLNKFYRTTGGLCFQNLADAKASMDHAQWRAPENDDTIPQTDEDHRKVTRHLVNAFKDMAIAKDTLNNAYRKRLTPGESVYYSDWAIEACAWDIVRMVKSIHTEGFKVPIYDKTILDSIGQTQEWTFEERINWICIVLKTSKNVAVTLMKHEKNWTILGAPHKLYNSTLVNAVSNANRNVWVKNGRKADAGHQDRVNKRLKIDHLIDLYSATPIKNTAPQNAIVANMGTGAVFTVPKRRARKSKYTIDTAPAALAPAMPPSSSAKVLAPSSISLTSPSIKSTSGDAEIINAIFGELPKRDMTDEQAGAAVDEAMADETVVEENTKEDTDMDTTKEVINKDNTATDTIPKKAIEKDNTKTAVPDYSHIPREEKIRFILDSYTKGVNYHPKPVFKPASDVSESESFLSNLPDDMFVWSDVPEETQQAPAALPSKLKIQHLEPPMRDAATMDAARLLASLYNSR